jgi:DNA-binding transcriptional LysR family regulator
MATTTPTSALQAALAGLGLVQATTYQVAPYVAEGRLETVMTDWRLPPIALHLVAPSGGPRPARVSALMDYLAKTFSAPLWPGDKVGR